MHEKAFYNIGWNIKYNWIEHLNEHYLMIGQALHNTMFC